MEKQEKLTSLLEETDGKPRKIDVASRRYGWKTRKKLTQHLRNDNEKAQELTLNRYNKSGEPRKIVAAIWKQRWNILKIVNSLRKVATRCRRYCGRKSKDGWKNSEKVSRHLEKEDDALWENRLKWREKITWQRRVNMRGSCVSKKIIYCASKGFTLIINFAFYLYREIHA